MIPALQMSKISGGLHDTNDDPEVPKSAPLKHAWFQHDFRFKEAIKQSTYSRRLLAS